MSLREPVSRPLDVIAAEAVLGLGQAFLTGILVWLAADFWANAGVAVPVLVLLAALGLLVGGCWIVWLLGGPGWPMALADFPVALLMAFVLLLEMGGAELRGVGALVPIVGLTAALYGIVCGFFLIGPRRTGWRGHRRRRVRAGEPAPVTPRISPTLSRAASAIPRPSPGSLARIRAVRVPRPSSVSMPRSGSLRLPRRGDAPDAAGRGVLGPAPRVAPGASAPPSRPDDRGGSAARSATDSSTSHAGSPASTYPRPAAATTPAPGTPAPGTPDPGTTPAPGAPAVAADPHDAPTLPWQRPPGAS